MDKVTTSGLSVLKQEAIHAKMTHCHMEPSACYFGGE